MDDWDSVRQKIKDLQSSLLNQNTDFRAAADSISVADYWKRRYEQEKELWEDKLSTKEREKSKMREKSFEDEQGVRELNFKLRQLEERLSSEKLIWEERSKIKFLEGELEKKKIELSARITMLEEENERLRQELRQGEEATEEEVKRRQQIELEKVRIEQELKNIQLQVQATALEEQKRINNLEQEKKSLLNQLDELKTTKKEGKEKGDEIEKELASLNVERNRQLALLGEREKEQFEAFEDLARGFAHKVRNYLGIISGTIQLCMANFKMEDELKKQVTLVDDNVQEMLKSIEEFLSLSKIPEMNVQVSEINELLSNVVFMMEEQARNQNIRLEKKLGEGLPPVSVDSKLLVEGFKQIIQNAIEASPTGSSIAVTSSYDSLSNKVVVHFVDKGKGIAENHKKRIFQAYFTTKKGKKGLGLPIAKRAVDLNHGSISIFSTKDQGTTVTVQLPAARPQSN